MKRDHVVIILIISFLEVITHFGAEAPDSHLFYDATYYFLGLHNFPDKPVGIARPLLPFLTSLILPFINDINLTYSVINSILYPLSGIFCYKLTQKIVNSPTLSLISSVMFLTSFSMVSYGASSYYMGAAIFFEFLVAFLAFKAVGKLSYAFFNWTLFGDRRISR